MNMVPQQEYRSVPVKFVAAPDLRQVGLQRLLLTLNPKAGLAPQASGLMIMMRGNAP
jgi:hypothetical protein